MSEVRGAPGPITAGDDTDRTDDSGRTDDMVAYDAAAGVTGATRRPRSALAFWRSPADQPGWARPTFLSITALAGLSYAWGMGNFPLEPFYAAAVRSMGASWRDFFFAGVDPAGTVSLDKLPGAFWVQALFVRVLGFHYWVVALPQVLAGVAVVLVLYRVVRRLVGPKAGVVAALVMVASPVTALANRGNVADPLWILLTVLAADATTTAVLTGRLRWLVLAGVWVGLAFETKMLQAWLLVPALFVTYLVAGSPELRRRLGHLALAGGVALIVSMSWMSVVAAVPAHDRPYVDGTTDDSIFAQVFVYNDWTRLGIHADADKATLTPQPFLAATVEATPDVGTQSIKASPDRLLVGPLGRDDGWLLPVALLSAVGILIARRTTPRTDLIRAGAILWGSWLVILLITFSKTTPLNSYYTAALIPAVAALSATGLALCWRSRTSSRTSRIILMMAVPLTTLYGIALVPGSSGEAWWLIPLAGLVCVMAEVALFASVRQPAPGDATRSAVAVAALSILLVPAVTTGVVVVYGLGSFSTPYQSSAANEGTTILPERYQSRGASLARSYHHLRPGPGIVAVVDSTALAAPLIMVTGREFLPIGGYLGSNPSPTLARLQHLVRTGQARYFQVPYLPPGSDPRVGWVRAHCQQMYSEPDTTQVLLGFYDCSRGPGPDS